MSYTQAAAAFPAAAIVSPRVNGLETLWNIPPRWQVARITSTGKLVLIEEVLKLFADPLVPTAATSTEKLPALELNSAMEIPMFVLLPQVTVTVVAPVDFAIAIQIGSQADPRPL